MILRGRGQPGYPWLVRVHAGLDEERRDSVEMSASALRAEMR